MLKHFIDYNDHQMKLALARQDFYVRNQKFRIARTHARVAATYKEIIGKYNSVLLLLELSFKANPDDMKRFVKDCK